MERKIGEIFEYNGEWYQCIHSSDCPKCDLKIIKNCRFKFPCESLRRKDCEEVIFKKLEKVGEPITVKGRTFQKLILDNCSCANCVFNIQNKKCYKNSYIDGPCPDDAVWVEIKQNKKQFSLDTAKGIYEELKGKTVQCLVNNEDGDLVNGEGVVCGYKDKYLIIGFRTKYEGCIKSFTDNGVFLENGNFLSYRFWNISHFNTIPFNLESAKTGKPVCTRNGKKVRIICFDKAGAHPVIALVQEEGIETCHFYSQDGKCADCGSEYDLMMLCKKKKGYVNIYSNMIHNTLENADKVKKRINNSNYMCTLEVEWEE